MVKKMSKLKLDKPEWKDFFVVDLFSEINRGRRLKTEDREEGKTPFVTAGEMNNGISDFVDNLNHKEYERAITVDMFGKTFYQKGKFKCDDNITVLKNDSFSDEIYIFLASSINILNSKYSYGNQLRPHRLSKDKIILPVNNKGTPHWKFMEDYIKQEQKIQAQKIIDYYESKMLKTAFDLVGLEDLEWKTFKFGEIFREIKRGKRLKKADHIEGDISYVSSTSFNNGVDAFIGNQDDVRTFSNNLTVANSGSVGSSFYHCYEYIASDHVTALTLENADKNIYLFMSTIVNRLSEKYSFNREINDTRIFRETLLLPADLNGNPHWDYMSKFMQNIESEKLQKAIMYIIVEYADKKMAAYKQVVSSEV